MHAEIKAQWVAALRSGEYKQGKSVLHNRETNEYCCLGVLCDLAVKAGVEVKQGEQSVTVGGDYVNPETIQSTRFGGRAQSLPAAVIGWAGLVEPDPMPEGVSDSLACLNDSGDTFDQIADVIERGL